MNRQKIKQGDFGYISHKKKTEILKTIVFFAIPLSLYIAGYATTKSRLNVLTIVAILGMLPASKQLVSMIMYLKAHGISEADHEAIKEAVVPICNSYDNIFTTYEKTYEVPSVVIRNGNVCGYVAKPYKDLKKLEDHITECAKKRVIRSTQRFSTSWKAIKTDCLPSRNWKMLHRKRIWLSGKLSTRSLYKRKDMQNRKKNGL